MSHRVCALALLVIAGAANAQINGVKIQERIFNDFPNSKLTTTNNFPALVQFNETNFGLGTFANRHAAYFSTDGGANAKDFNYGDAFDVSFTLDLDATPANGREAGFHVNSGGDYGFFGVLPNGEIAAFGGSLPFFSAGAGVWTPGAEVQLRLVHTPGDGTAANPSVMDYMYNTGSGWVTVSKNFDNAEFGLVTANNVLIGFGVQNQGGPGGSSNALFTNIVVPAPSALAMMGVAGLVASRRRRA